MNQHKCGSRFQKLAVLLTLSAALSNAEWIYRQYDDQKMVSFSHQPAAAAAQLQRAKLALEKIAGVEEVYIKDRSVVILKERKCSWDDIWPAISNTMATLEDTKTAAASYYRASR